MRKSTQADLVLLGVVTLWGTSFALVKGALHYVSPILFVIMRFVLAGLIWGALYGRRLRRARPGTLFRGIVLGVVLGGGFVFQTAGLTMTSASMSGFITGLNVVVVPLLVIAIERRLPRMTSLLGVAICTFGLFVLSRPSGGGLNTGDLLTIGCAVMFALYIVLVEVYTADGTWDGGALALAQAFGVLAVGLVTMPLLETASVQWAWPLVWRFLVLGTMAALTLALQLHWQRHISATRAAIIFTLEPPFAALFAFLILGEVLTGGAYLGGGLIFLGMLVAEAGARLMPAAAPPAPDSS